MGLGRAHRKLRWFFWVLLTPGLSVAESQPLSISLFSPSHTVCSVPVAFPNTPQPDGICTSCSLCMAALLLPTQLSVACQSRLCLRIASSGRMPPTAHSKIRFFVSILSRSSLLRKNLVIPQFRSHLCLLGYELLKGGAYS